MECSLEIDGQIHEVIGRQGLVAAGRDLGVAAHAVGVQQRQQHGLAARNRVPGFRQRGV